VRRPTRDGLIDKDIAIPDLDVEAALRIAAHPRLVVYRRSLTAKVGKGEKISALALAALRPNVTATVHNNLLGFAAQEYEAAPVYTAFPCLNKR
jgi:hypothetical protein